VFISIFRVGYLTLVSCALWCVQIKQITADLNSAVDKVKAVKSAESSASSSSSSSKLQSTAALKEAVVTAQSKREMLQKKLAQAEDMRTDLQKALVLAEQVCVCVCLDLHCVWICIGFPAHCLPYDMIGI